MKKISALLMTVCLLVGLLSGIAMAGASEEGADEAAFSNRYSGNALPFRVLSADEMVAEMGTGWNLGNTMDGHTGFTPNETLWQNTKTTQELITAIHDMGFNTIRIPITWGTTIDDAHNYSIDKVWMDRVQEIVDYAIAQDMYVIINIHHDGAEQTGWLRIASSDFASVKKKFIGVWKQIASRFKNYDEHLIFESMNEVTGNRNTDQDNAAINELNQAFVNVVRSTGGNNSERWLSVPARYANLSALNAGSFQIPEDTVENRLFVAFHYYDGFGITESMQDTTTTMQEVKSIANAFASVVTKFTSKGIPVILGEYGAINKNNSDERAYYLEAINAICKKDGIVPVYWDQGWYDRSQNPDYSFSLVDRVTCESVDKTVTDALIRGYFQNYADVLDVVKQAEVKAISSITTSSETVKLAVGDTTDVMVTTAPTDNNDVVLWSSADTSVATVYNGKIHAKGVGSTVITAKAQSGNASVSITVNVSPAAKVAYEISVASDETTLEQGESIYLNPTLSDNFGNAKEDDSVWFSYRSSNPSVATVSTLGKVTAISGGVAYITITNSNGVTKTVKVNVNGKEATNSIRLALNVYYNDSTHEYFGNEVGSEITVSGNGTYTLTFSCGKDLSDAAKAAGVTALKNMTAIYIKDQDVTEGLAEKSALVSCDITYNTILVNGKALTIKKPDAKSALKDSGIFDTNDPINSRDGSAVEEAKSFNHVANFTTIENPTAITVIFTLSNLVFEENKEEPEEVEYTTPTIEVTTLGLNDNEVKVKGNAQTYYLVSSDPSAAGVTTYTATADASGVATFHVNGITDGSTTLTVYPENGEVVSKNVLVSSSYHGNDPTYTDPKEDKPSTSDNTNTNPETKPAAVTEREKVKMSGKTYVIILGALLLLGVMGTAIWWELQKQKKYCPAKEKEEKKEYYTDFME